MILLLVLEAGEVDSLKIFGPLCGRFFLVTGGGGGGGGGGGLGWSTIEAFHSVKDVFFVCVLEESP